MPRKYVRFGHRESAQPRCDNDNNNKYGTPLTEQSIRISSLVPTSLRAEKFT